MSSGLIPGPQKLMLMGGLLYLEDGRLVTVKNYDRKVRQAYGDASERWQQQCADEGRKITWLPDGEYWFDGNEMRPITND